jgi:stage III sporulation protein AE
LRRIVTLCLVLSFVIMPVSAEEFLPEEYYDFSNSIPEDVASMLPDGFFSGDISELSDSLFKVTSPKYILGVIFDLLSGGLGGAFSLFALLVGMLALSSLLLSFTEGIAVGELKNAVNYAISICISGAVVGLQVGRIIVVSNFFQRLVIIMNSLIPIMGALYLSGGNTLGAALASSSLLVQINLIEIGVSSLVIPAVSACLALALADSLVTGESRLAGISASIKRTLVFIFGLCSTLLMATLSAQNVLASASDSAGARAVKFLAGNMIPVVGSTVGDMLRTLTASVKLMRSTVGVAGIVVLAFLLLPTIIELFLTRFTFNTAAAVGELLGCKSAVRLYREIASLYGYIISAAVLSSLLCVFALTLFAIGQVAIGGG